MLQVCCSGGGGGGGSGVSNFAPTATNQTKRLQPDLWSI